MRRTKIVATIGPASESPEMLARLVKAGVDVARLNMSHGTIAEHRRRIEALRAVATETGRPLAIMIDLKGPEMRLGTFANGRVELAAGELFTITSRPVVGSERAVTIELADFAHYVAPGETILLDDGNLKLIVEDVSEHDVVCRVIDGGPLSNRKKVNLPGVKVPLPAVGPDDLQALRLGAEMQVDFVAASFVRSAADVLAVRHVIEEAGGDQSIIAKVENAEGVDNLDEILRAADGLMVARGDLGVEIPAEEVPLYQKTMIERCLQLGKPVITATQMLESMVEHARPTRAEASDVANAIFDGTDAIMLSAETAAGKHPLAAVETMARIAERTEQALGHDHFLARREQNLGRTVTNAVGHATCSLAASLGATAIITATASGHTARLIARYRPAAHIIATVTSERVARRLALVWGVTPLVVAPEQNTDALIEESVAAALAAHMISDGDLVVVTAGVPVGIPGTTNLIKVHTVGDVLVRGTGIGTRSITGRIVVCRTGREAVQRLARGDILVAPSTDLDYADVIASAAGIIAEEGGLASHAAKIAVRLGVPAVVGAEGATARLRDGDVVTIDAARGLVYKGKTRV
ncbi:MAG: pyruvate kinase [Chloroflexota bacterium]